LVFLNVYLTKKYYILYQESSNSIDKVNGLNNENMLLKKDIENIIKRDGDIAQIFHNVFHENRKIVYKFNDALFNNNFDNYNSIIKSFEKYTLFMVNNIKEIFDLLTNEKCNICIKFIISNSENPKELLVKTWLRDSISYRERSEIDRKLPNYPCNENTAFKRIISDEYSESYFLSNDLLNERGYINLNPNWQNSYNACLVVPIRIALSENEYSIVGFICVDNTRGGFDKPGFNILASFADSCFNLFYIFNNFKNKAMEANRKGGAYGGN
jgi:hypothetical protein